MTGRDLIVYILQNGLEDLPVYEGGKLLGFMTAMDAAIKFEVGLNTIYVWHDVGILEGVKIGDVLYIPANIERPNLNNRKE